jgi:rod shape-determining protein MreC
VRIRKNAFKALAVFLILIIIIFNSKTIGVFLRTASGDLGAPALSVFNAACGALSDILPFASLKNENKLLRDRLSLVVRQVEEIKVIYGENKRLKELLELKKTLPYTTIPAQVIGRDPSNWSNSIVIDKGAIQGIRSSKAVLSPRGLVGRVVEVGRHSSRILLITDPASKVGVLVQRNRQGGILVGRPDGKCKMIYISLDSDVAAGDRVITAGFGSVFPKNILVGDVVKVDREPGRLYKYAIVEPAQDLSKLEEVLCIR